MKIKWERLRERTSCLSSNQRKSQFRLVGTTSNFYFFGPTLCIFLLFPASSKTILFRPGGLCENYEFFVPHERFILNKI